MATLRQVLPKALPGANGHMELDDELESNEDDHHEIPAGMTPVADINEELQSRVKLAKSAGAEAYHSDDEDDMPRGQRVQCAQS